MYIQAWFAHNAMLVETDSSTPFLGAMLQSGNQEMQNSFLQRLLFRGGGRLFDGCTRGSLATSDVAELSRLSLFALVGLASSSSESSLSTTDGCLDTFGVGAEGVLGESVL